MRNQLRPDNLFCRQLGGIDTAGHGKNQLLVGNPCDSTGLQGGTANFLIGQGPEQLAKSRDFAVK